MTSAPDLLDSIRKIRDGRHQLADRGYSLVAATVSEKSYRVGRTEGQCVSERGTCPGPPTRDMQAGLVIGTSGQGRASYLANGTSPALRIIRHARTVCCAGLGRVRGNVAHRPAGRLAGDRRRRRSSPCSSSVTERLARATRETGKEVRADPAELITGRAALAGFTRRGQVSAGGSSFLLRCADGWCAVTLSRPDDLAAIPAILGVLGLEGAGSAAERAQRARGSRARPARRRSWRLPRSC